MVVVMAAAVAAAAPMPTASSAIGGPPLNPRFEMETLDAEALVAMLHQLRNHGDALDASFLGLCGILVFLMQTGFAMLTAGYVGDNPSCRLRGLVWTSGGSQRGEEEGWSWNMAYRIFSGGDARHLAAGGRSF